MRIILQCVILFLFCANALFSVSLPETGFWDLMKRDNSKEHQQAIHSKGWILFKTLFYKYQKNKEALLKTHTTRIPHKIHLIWLGTPMPEFSRKMVETWKKIHPDWEVLLWTDADLPSFGLKNSAAYEKSTNWGEKSDIFRYEILYRYGGLYVDAADFECIRRFDELHDTCDFYVGIAYGKRSIVYNGLIGCRPHHPIMKRCINSIKIGNGDNSRWRIVKATGPLFLTKCMKASLADSTIKKKQGIVVPFPTIVFYPFPDVAHTQYSNIDNVKKEFLCPEAFAIHYWKSSWDIHDTFENM